MVRCGICNIDNIEDWTEHTNTKEHKYKAGVFSGDIAIIQNQLDMIESKRKLSEER
jgi:hypothetical protein